MSFAGGNEAVVEKYFIIQWGEFPVRWQLDFNWTSDQTRKAPFYLLPGRVGLVSKAVATVNSFCILSTYLV